MESRQDLIRQSLLSEMMLSGLIFSVDLDAFARPFDHYGSLCEDIVLQKATCGSFPASPTVKLLVFPVPQSEFGMGHGKNNGVSHAQVQGCAPVRGWRKVEMMCFPMLPSKVGLGHGENQFFMPQSKVALGHCKNGGCCNAPVQDWTGALQK